MGITIDAEVIREIAEEIDRGNATHIAFPADDPVRCAGLLCEEAGEVMKDALDFTRPRRVGTGAFTYSAAQMRARELREHMKVELIQTAAVAVQWLHILRREDEEAAERKRVSDSGSSGVTVGFGR